MTTEAAAMTYDPNTPERIAWRALCEQLAAEYLAAAVDVTEVDVRDELVAEPVRAA